MSDQTAVHILPPVTRPSSGREPYEALVDSVGGIVWEFSFPEHRFTFVGGQVEPILGYPVEQWLNEPDFWSSHLHPEDRAAAVAFRESAARRGEDHQLEYRIVAADGRIVWARDLVTVEMDEGHPSLIRGVLIDVTQRKKEEALLSGQMRVLETIAADAPLSTILESIVRLIESQSDGLVCSILLLNKDGTHVMHGAAPNLPEGYRTAIDGAPIGPKAGSCGTAMFRGKQVIVHDINEDPLWEDYRGLAAQFGLRACWSTPIVSHKGAVLGSFAMYYQEPRSPNTEEIHLIGVATHIAAIAIERRQAEEKLRASEERYRRIVDTANEGIWVVDETRMITFVNRRMAEMLGWEREELIGHYANEFMGDGAEDEEDNRRQERRREGIAEQFDLRFNRKDGSERWGIVSTTPVHGEGGEFGGALGMVTDITQRKGMEADLRRSNGQIREMASKLLTAQEEERRRISRELHDDIVQKAAVLAISMSRIRRKLTAADHAIATDLAGIQQGITGLADDIRGLSHRLHPAVLEHAGLVPALRSFTEEFSRLEGLDVRLQVPESHDTIPREVGICVYRVVQEGLRNIVRHSGAKSAEVILSIVDNDLQLAVKDEGNGFDVDVARISGLGMVSIQERVRLCQGTVDITSRFNHGTTLKVRIPLSPA